MTDKELLLELFDGKCPYTDEPCFCEEDCADCDVEAEERSLVNDYYDGTEMNRNCDTCKYRDYPATTDPCRPCVYSYDICNWEPIEEEEGVDE